MSVDWSLTPDAAFFDPDEYANIWLLATMSYGVGDIVTTMALVRFSARVQEANLLLQYVVNQFGQFGLVALKLAVFMTCIAISLTAARDEDRFVYYVPPVVLTLVGTFTTVYNLRLLLG